ncbi:hypothetical protein FE697_015370 [Mumia zhuanghuii]|uniref:Uncharacterized protein n=2 Tax=Mumia TaxID=1546255 RepID=A0ABW1QUF4_9ACTN|nr:MULTISPECIES: hypothetical protein [Mumia]KAA1422512.1 hypothetical protein FE697_015370 [Mumia zhuanghuii]
MSAAARSTIQCPYAVGWCTGHPDPSFGEAPGWHELEIAENVYVREDECVQPRLHVAADLGSGGFTGSTQEAREFAAELVAAAVALEQIEADLAATQVS